MTDFIRKCALLTVAVHSAAGLVSGQDKPGRLEIAVLDKPDGPPVPCRVHLKDAAGKPQRADKFPFWFDHFVCPGTALLEQLPPGKYTIEIERGPEYELHTDSFSLEAGGSKKVTAVLKRLADLPAEGWWPVDRHVHRPVGGLVPLMRA